MVAQQKIRDTALECVGNEISPIATTTVKANPGSPKSRLAMLKRSSTRTKTNVASNDPFRFQGNGIDFKAKLIGEREVAEARGDAMCAEAMRLAKASVKLAGTHKLRIILNISIEGLKIKDEKSGLIIYNFPVSKISFIARDTTDARAFGFIFGTLDAKYKFYGIKTAQTADHAVLSIRDMFQVVFEMKKKQIQEVKQKKEEQENLENFKRETEVTKTSEKNCRIEGGVAVADLLDLESELQNIELGFNQLQNIPSMPEDDMNFVAQWNSSGGTSTTANGTFNDPFDDSFFNPTPSPTQLQNQSILTTVLPINFGLNQPLANNANLSTSLKENNLWSANCFNNPPTQNLIYSGTNPFASIQQQTSNNQNQFGTQNGFTNSFDNNAINNNALLDPFDTQSAHRVINAINNVHSYGYLPPLLSLQQQQQNSLNNVASAPVLNQTNLFSLNSTATIMPNSIPPPQPTGTPFVTNHHQPFVQNNFVNNFNNNKNNQNNNNNNNNDQMWAALNNGSVTLKENKAPTINFASAFENDKNSKWSETGAQRVTTLEEAFSKLVDMDQLVSTKNTSDVRKNPFDHILNPPKMPLNALLTHFP